MTERAIRDAIRSRLPRLLRPQSEARIVEEMEICQGRSRADMAVISDALIGIEIKGPQDSVDRLANQAVHYSSCFDYVFLVVDESLARQACKLVPRWWGVIVSSTRDNKMSCFLKRRPKQNRSVVVENVLSLLWRNEVEVMIDRLVGAAAPVRKSKQELRKVLLHSAPPQLIKQECIKQLRDREDWRSQKLSELPSHRQPKGRQRDVMVDASRNPGPLISA